MAAATSLSVAAPLKPSSPSPSSSSSSSFRTKPIGRAFLCVRSQKPKVSTARAQAAAPSWWAGEPQTARSAMQAAEADVMELLLRHRVVFLGCEIEDMVADWVMSQLLLLDAQDPAQDIRLFINSPGGSLSAAMAIYDVIQLVRADVSTVGIGTAGSTSAIILGGGTKGKRFAMPNTRIMIHQPGGGASGEALDVAVQAKEMMANKRNVIRLISGFTGRTLEQVEQDIDKDRYMGPIEAVEYGIIDGVIDKDAIIPLQPVPERVRSRFKYEELSEDPKAFFVPDVSDDDIY